MDGQMRPPEATGTALPADGAGLIARASPNPTVPAPTTGVHDPKVDSLTDEFMFGPDFLVAPVTHQGQTQRKVYRPAGADWYDYWTNREYHDGRCPIASW